MNTCKWIQFYRAFARMLHSDICCYSVCDDTAYQEIAGRCAGGIGKHIYYIPRFTLPIGTDLTVVCTMFHRSSATSKTYK